MTSDIFFILILSFLALGVILLIFSKRFRKSVFGHMFDWIAKKMSRIFLIILGLVFIALVFGFFGPK